VADKIRMKMKLLDLKIIEGPVYIDRSKNLDGDHYEASETDDKIIVKKKQSTIMGKELGIDFEKLMKDRKPQGINTGFKTEAQSASSEKEPNS
jgi:hypothetical protein